MASNDRPVRKAAPRKAPPKAAPTVDEGAMLSALAASTEALSTVTVAVDRMTTALEATDASNQDTAAWRARAEEALSNSAKAQRNTRRALVGVVLAVAVAIGTVAYYQDREDDRAAAVRLDGCRERNDTQRGFRSLFSVTFDTLEVQLGVSDDVLAPLRANVDTFAEKDRDCDGDGMLTTADYPPEAVDPRAR